jgi:hypothetical protein
MTATTVSGRKQKARFLQNLVADKIERFFDCRPGDVKPAIMGESGVDIHLSPAMQERLPLAIECKYRESLNIWDAMKQTEANAAKTGLKPALFFKRARSPVYVCVRMSDFMWWMRLLSDHHCTPIPEAISEEITEGETA